MASETSTSTLSASPLSPGDFHFPTETGGKCLSSANTGSPSETKMPSSTTCAIHRDVGHKNAIAPTMKKPPSSQSLQSLQSTPTSSSSSVSIGPMSPKRSMGGKLASKKPPLKASYLTAAVSNNLETIAPVRLSSFFCKRHVACLLFALVFGVVGIYLLPCFLNGTSAADVREIDARVAGLTFSEDQEEEQLLEARAARSTSRKILVVGMVESLQELWENEPVWVPIAQLCWAHTPAESSTSTVDVRVLYRTKNRENSGVRLAGGDVDFAATQLRNHLIGYGCQITFQSEDELWDSRIGKERDQFLKEFKQLSRYKRLAKLRSHQRRYILETAGSAAYEVVVNVDMDIVSLPPIVPLLKAIDHVADQGANGFGSIVCANGFENWVLGNGLIRRPLFYDTMAAVDIDGKWGYTSYTTNAQQVVGFGQAILLRDILRQQSDLWPMQSCFGGVALYDMATWATPQCDYDLDGIQLLTVPSMNKGEVTPIYPVATMLRTRLREVTPAPHAFVEQLNQQKDQLKQPSQRWTLDPKYTLSGKPNGDACEHVTFQQCLYAASRDDSNVGTKRPLKVGIQPELIIRRQAAIVSRWEDVIRVVAGLGRLALMATGIVLMLVPCIKCFLQLQNGDRTTRNQLQNLVDKHGHAA